MKKTYYTNVWSEEHQSSPEGALKKRALLGARARNKIEQENICEKIRPYFHADSNKKLLIVTIIKKDQRASLLWKGIWNQADVIKLLSSFIYEFS